MLEETVRNGTLRNAGYYIMWYFLCSWTCKLLPCWCSVHAPEKTWSSIPDCSLWTVHLWGSSRWRRRGAQRGSNPRAGGVCTHSSTCCLQQSPPVSNSFKKRPWSRVPPVPCVTTFSKLPPLWPTFLATKQNHFCFKPERNYLLEKSLYKQIKSLFLNFSTTLWKSPHKHWWVLAALFGITLF